MGSKRFQIIVNYFSMFVNKINAMIFGKNIVYKIKLYKASKEDKAIIFTLVIMFVAIILLASCNNLNNTTAPVSGSIKARLLDYSDCKTNIINDQIFVLDSSNQDCIEYNYNIDKVLKLKHYNAAFNCCPAKITADIKITENIITITEHEQSQGCKCNCLYDLSYELKNVPNGKYKIIINEPYKLESEQDLEVEINLIPLMTGDSCVKRNHYPWILN